MWFLFVRSEVCPWLVCSHIRLPSDPTSRWAPLLSAVSFPLPGAPKKKSPETLISQRFRGSHPHRGDKIRTCGLRVPNAALYQTEPRLDLYLLLRTNRSKQMLSYLIFTEASSPVLRFYCFYCFSVCRTVPFVIASRRSVFCLITNAITPEST